MTITYVVGSGTISRFAPMLRRRDSEDLQEAGEEALGRPEADGKVVSRSHQT